MNMVSELPFYSISNYELLKIFEYDKLRLSDLVENQSFLQYIDKVHTSREFQQLNFEYCTETHFNNQISKTIRERIDLSVYHLNIRSLNSNHRGLCQYLSILKLKFDVIVLSEIWSNNISGAGTI